MDITKSQSSFDKATQILLPALTLTGFGLTGLKKPGLGLIFNLFAQIFWLYAGWKAWKKAGQIGLFVTAIFLTLILFFGVANYWLF